jgi:hypothetical protein
MRITRLTAGVSVLLLTLAVSVCALPAPGSRPAAALIAGNAENGGVALGAALPELNYAGTAIPVFVVLQNRGPNNITFASANAYLDFRLHLTDARGNAVPMTPDGIAQSLPPTKRVTGRLLRGEVASQVFDLRTLFQLRKGESYQLQVSHGLDDVMPAGKPSEITVKLRFKIAGE